MTPPFSAIGAHLIIEFWGADHLTDVSHIELAMRDAALAANAVVLEVKLHEFAGNGGITGVALLAESHISIHTWPEHEYAALDVFICGGEDPHLAVAVLQERFSPTAVQVSEIPRGIRGEALDTTVTVGVSVEGQ